MICDKTTHHPLGATKAYEYTTLQTQYNKRSIDRQSRIIKYYPDDGAIRLIETLDAAFPSPKAIV